jgi:hypothetical protein
VLPSLGTKGVSETTCLRCTSSRMPRVFPAAGLSSRQIKPNYGLTLSSSGTLVSTAMSGMGSGGLAIDDLESARRQPLAFNIRPPAHPRTVFLHRLRPGGLPPRIGCSRFLCFHAANMTGDQIKGQRRAKRADVAQVSKPAVSPISKSAARGDFKTLEGPFGVRVWKPAIQQTRRSALHKSAASLNSRALA